MTLSPPSSWFFPGLRSRREWVALALILAGTVAFYGWTASPEGAVWRQGGSAAEYYNSEVKGFRAGHLWMAATPAPQLQVLADPYDPVQNAPYRLHDASYYRGHYYLYFGVTPAVLFFWPIKALTGGYASEPQAVFFFSVLGYLTSLGLLTAVRRRYFPEAGLAALAGGAIALGLATMVPTLLRRPAVYEVPIACAYAGNLLALAALWRALHSGRRVLWTALASLAYGLTVGARPNYALGAIFLLAPCWQQFRAGTEGRRPRALVRTAAAAIGPITLVVAALLTYNFERFGRVSEFGLTYQLTGVRTSTVVQFSSHFFAFNCRLYLLAAARVCSYFPYVAVIRPPPLPPGYLGIIEDPFGVLPNMPWVALALLVPWVAWGRPRFGPWLTAALGTTLIGIPVLFSINAATNRYMIDFLPPLVLAAAIVVLALETRLRGWPRILARVAWIAALAWSALFGLLASIQHNDLLRINHPSVYAPIARVGNLPSNWVDELRGTKYGPLELTLRFPVGRRALEPILVSGAGFKSDYLYVLYVDSRHVIFGFEHSGYGGPVTEPVEVDFQQEHHLRLDLGALYPPQEHPYFAHWSPADIAAHLRRLRLFLDGRSLMDDPVECYDPVARSPWIGVSPESEALGRRFTGVISSQRRVASAAPDPFGAVRLYLELPRRPPGTSEPLLTTGVTGRGDLIRIVYVDAGHVRFIHDRWMFGGSSSADIPVHYEGRHRIQLSLGSLYPDGPWTAAVPARELARLRARVTVKLDGVPVLDVTEPSHPAAPATTVIGANGIGASLTDPLFTGRILNQQRVWDP